MPDSFNKPLVLIVDDDASMFALMEEQLVDHGYQSITASNVPDALAILERARPMAVVTDIKMPGQDGLSLCRHISTHYPSIPVLVMTAFGNMERAIEAMRAGAFDFLPKPFRFEVLDFALKKALRLNTLEEELETLREERSGVDEKPQGVSKGIRHVRSMIKRFALLNVPVNIHGESGVGKELVARAIHDQGTRADKPYVSINCAAMPMELLESELFGHARGAFTGANTARQGLFRHAHGGTLFFDEIGDMPAVLQAKLLRVLEESKVRPVGSDQEIDVDVRILSATHRDLPTLVKEGTFRQDLMYRLGAITIEVPALRERPEDIPILAHRLLNDFTPFGDNARPHTLPPETLRWLVQQPWPGNVRELKNALIAAAAMHPNGNLSPSCFIHAQEIHPSNTTDVSVRVDADMIPSLEQVIQDHIRHVLKAVDGNKSKAARILGIDRKTLYSKLESP